MADKQALNATFFAFRKREKGGVLLGATLSFALVLCLVLGLFAYLNWHAVADYIAWVASMGQSVEKVDPNDPSAAFAAIMPPASVMQLGSSYFLFLIVYYLLIASYEAACLRWMIRGEAPGLFGITLDADVLRVYFTYWLWFFLLMALYIVIIIIAVGVGVGVAIGAQGGDGAVGPSIGIAALACLAVLFGVSYFAVRFAPAAATSVAKRRFAFFDAWTVSKGRFWALFGAFLLLLLMYLVGVIILFVGMGVTMGMGIVGQIQAHPEPQSPQEAFAFFATPSVWAPMAVCYGLMLVGAFTFYIALFGVNARAALAALEEGKIKAAE
jgi:hypothetical protein